MIKKRFSKEYNYVPSIQWMLFMTKIVNYTKKQASAVELFNLFHYVNASCTAFCVVRKQLED